MRCAAARATMQLLELIRGVWLGRADRYSELRAELRSRDRRAAQGRNVLHRWLMATPGLADAPRSTRNRPDHGRRRRQGRHAARGRGRGARALAAGRGARRCAPAAIARRRARYSTPPSSPGVMAAKRTHELIPFCHPLALENCRHRDRRPARRRDRHPLPGGRASPHRRGDGSADRRDASPR